MHKIEIFYGEKKLVDVLENQTVVLQVKDTKLMEDLKITGDVGSIAYYYDSNDEVITSMPEGYLEPGQVMCLHTQGKKMKGDIRILVFDKSSDFEGTERRQFRENEFGTTFIGFGTLTEENESGTTLYFP